MWSLSPCFLSDFLFLPIGDGGTFVKYMISAAPLTFHALLLLQQHHRFLSLHTRKFQKTPPKKNLNLKKISVRNFLFNIHTASEAHFFLMYYPPTVLFLFTYHVKSQKNPLLLYIHCHPLFANRTLQNYGKADRPCALCYWPINYTLLPGLHLSCSMTGSSMVTL